MLSDQVLAAGIQSRFALLHHAVQPGAARLDHWDLMFENQGVLVTFELERFPVAQHVLGTRRLPDHSLHYLDYEGDISGNRGQVMRLDRGVYQLVTCNDLTAATNSCCYQLNGARLTATVAFDMPFFALPFAQPVQLQALEWDWHD